MNNKITFLTAAAALVSVSAIAQETMTFSTEKEALSVTATPLTAEKEAVAVKSETTATPIREVTTVTPVEGTLTPIKETLTPIGTAVGPEPSSAILGCIAGLGFLARRRR